MLFGVVWDRISFENVRFLFLWLDRDGTNDQKVCLAGKVTESANPMWLKIIKLS